jgi:hypothetical protein
MLVVTKKVLASLICHVHVYDEKRRTRKHPSRKRDCTLRNKDSHENVLEIENPEQTKAFREFLSTKYGINNRCPLSSLVYFDPTKCFMQDLMHVFHEGVLNTASALLLKP